MPEGIDESEKQQAGEEKPTRNYDLSNGSDLFALIREKDDELLKREVTSHVAKILASYHLDSYTVVLLFDDCDLLTTYHANQVYDAASEGGTEKDILLILQSPGGRIEPAYLISKTCKRLSKGKFSVAVPRRAKSAATLITLGADEIHLGLLSELGPIDPQIGGYPALSLANALNKLAELACQFPQSSDMWANYLTKNLNLRDLGYLERLSESAVQYAERLLSSKSLPKPHTAESLADHFVRHYKDHAFVIDMDETKSLLGESIVKSGTSEYQAANAVYKFLDFLEFLLRVLIGKEFYYVGAIKDGLSVREIKKK